MNAHLPQSLQTHEELVQLANVSTQIISPRECKPIISVVQDIVLGLYRMTKPNIRVTQKQLFNLMTSNPKCNGLFDEPIESNGQINKWSGHQILSTIMPSKINVKRGNNQYDDSKPDPSNFVKIVNGKVMSGTFDKDIYQARTVGIIHSIYNEYGPEETKDFFDNTQKLICNFLVLNGFSVGISDLIVDQDTVNSFQTIIKNMKTNADNIIAEIHSTNQQNPLIQTNDEFEKNVNNLLNQAINKVGEGVAQQIDENTNRMITMIKSKSKGNTVNVSQMIGCVGQQNVDGKRIPYGFDERTLPHYKRYDDGPESRGFVESSFINGLTPQEFFFAAMGGREGLIDTAVQSVTGDTPIIILENGKAQRVNIGDWIDGHLDRADKNDIQVFPEQHNMEFYKFDTNKTKVFIPTGDNKGNTSWGELSAITRHDVGAALFEIETESGRIVKVVDSKSLLVWNERKKEFQECDTSKVVVGDCLPTTMYLPSVPEECMITEIDMADYFPKTEYLYGSEFWTAVEYMEKAMEGKQQIPRGWWEANNGVNFITPFAKKAHVQRVMVRSNTDGIKNGMVYNFKATRGICQIPDKFEMNEENGIFIGLYLAEGSTHELSGKVSIANQDPTILAFCEKWFDKFNMSHKTYQRDVTMASGKEGSTTSIQGYSTMMVRFMDAFVGKGAANKYVPNEAFNGPDEFAKGILNGYFSGDGCISKDTNGINVSSISYRLIEGISMLMNRFGIFSKMTTSKQEENNLGTENIARMYHLSIRAVYASNFANHINLIKPCKNERLQRIKDYYEPKEHRNFQPLQDVVLDKVKRITPINKDLFPKVYDVTVLSTLNFTCASGLVMSDTSEVGYLQRKLVKAMEDCKVHFDRSVRNANGSIIQFLYGEDGMDSSKIESQPIPYLREINKNIRSIYSLSLKEMRGLLTDEAYEHATETEETWTNDLEKHLDFLEKDHMFITNDLKLDSNVMYPVSILRTLTITKSLFASNVTDLTPDYVLSTIDKLTNELFVNSFNKGNLMLKILLRAYLTPRSMIIDYRFTKDALDYIASQIKMKFFESLAHPSEMVGVIAAQSIGEPATQLTLNSIEWNTEVLLKGTNNALLRVKIGEFIDSQINNRIAKSEIENHPNDTTLGWIKDQNYSILSCDENGQVSWKLIEAVTKHPPINEDGSNTLLKVTTKSGREVIATKAKSFLKRIDNKIIPVRGDDLNVGDYLPVSTILGHDDVLEYLPCESIVPNIITKEHGDINSPRALLPKYIAESKCPEDIEIYKSVMDETILYDKVVSIEVVVSDHPHVYDFTVKDTRNFNIFNGLCIRDTFHLAGVSAASQTVRGVPRLRELLSVSKNMKTPSMKIYFKDDVKYDCAKVCNMMNDIRIVRFKDIVTTSEIYFDPNNNLASDVDFIQAANMFDGSPIISNSPWVLRFEFDRAAMFEYNLVMSTITSTLMKKYEYVIQYNVSDDNAVKPVCRIKLNQSNTDDMLTNLKALEFQILELIIKGTEFIEGAHIETIQNSIFNPITNEVEKEKVSEFMVFTEGTNLLGIFANRNVDCTRTYSNNIKEIYDVLGIEAARQALYKEIHEVLESITVNYRHTSLLVDVQTNKGFILSIDRHGINRGDIGPLAKCSFEETTDKLVKAGIFSESDKINGVSANIMLGQVVPAGTGDVDVLMDENMLKEGDSESESDSEDEEVLNDELDMCDIENFEIDFNVPSAKENIAVKKVD